MSIIKSFSVGEGDMFYIKHESSNFTMIDCFLTDENKEVIVNEIIAENKNKDITRFISTHPDDDHIGGLKYLDDKINILNFYCVKNAYDEEDSEDYERYYELRDDNDKAYYIYEGCNRKWMNQNDKEKQYGSAGINILWPITSNSDFKDALSKANNGDSPNNISPIIKYSMNGGVKVLWFGDLEASFTEKIQDAITLPSADIIFAPHHGRGSGKLPKKWLDQIDPQIIVIGEAPSKHLDYYSGYNTITQNTAGDIIFECEDSQVHIYVSNQSYSVKFLDDEDKDDSYGYYLGSLTVKDA